MFVAAVGGVVGVVVIGAVNHSDYSDHSDHYNYSEYGDSSELDEIKKLEDEVNKKEKGIEAYKRDAKEKYQARLNELKQEETYASLDAAKVNILEDVKKEMQAEVAAEIQDEKQQLEYIDQMIARINEIELAENHQGGKSKSYIVGTVEDFFAKLDRMQQELAKFSQEIDDRSEKIPALLRNFEKAVFAPSEDMKLSSKNVVDKAAQNSLANLRTSIESWRHKIEQDRKGREFIKKNEKYLVVMIFGAVKTGKSSLGNFFAGQKFLTAPFDNPYKHIAPPVFETEERGRNSGDVEKDENGNTWFSEGVTDTTGTIQYFTLSGLRWVDSPGTWAVEKDGYDMTKLVEEYLPYTDMCIFLMNSSEPGLQDDMRYMNELNKQGQEALIVITRSDKKEEDVDDEGNLISVTIPKTPENRKLQEDDCCRRVKIAYPNIDAEKFRAISISTKLAKEAIAENDDEKYKASNLDKLMQILGNKVSDNTLARKQENPRRLLNGFIEQILSDLGGFNDDLNKMQEAVNKYKNDMGALADIIVSNVKQEVRIEITQLSNDWNRQVNHGGKFDSTNVNKSISQVVQEKLNKEINRQMPRVIEGYEQQELPHVQANLEVGTLEKSTNIDEFMDELMPQVEQFSRDEATASLKMLENSYFHQQEQFVGKMRQEISHLEDELNKLKV